MIAMQKAYAGGFFTLYDTRPHPTLGYSTLPGSLVPVSHGELARLMHCGALEKDSHGFGALYLTPRPARSRS